MNIIEKFNKLKNNKNARILKNVEFATIIEDLFYLYQEGLNDKIIPYDYFVFGNYEGEISEFSIDRYGDLIINNYTGLSQDVVIHQSLLINKYTVIEISEEDN